MEISIDQHTWCVYVLSSVRLRALCLVSYALANGLMHVGFRCLETQDKLPERW